MAAHLTTTFDVLTQLKDSTGHMLGAPNLVPIDGEPYPLLPDPAKGTRVPGRGGVDWNELRVRRHAHQGGSTARTAPLIADGDQLAEGVVHQIYGPTAAAGGAYAFNTPEAWNGRDTTTYRAAYYVRALAAWDMSPRPAGSDSAELTRLLAGDAGSLSDPASSSRP